VQPRAVRPLADRFWPKVARRGSDECWPWLASTNGVGYGQIARGRAGTGMIGAHRVAYELLVGPIPAGLHLDHLCRNTLCVNPAHLEAVSARTNIRRGVAPSIARSRADACPHGHPFTPENTHITPRGYRQCRECGRLRQGGLPEREHAYVAKPRRVTK